MELIHLPSQNCPKCGSTGGTCSLVVLRLYTFQDFGVREKEKTFMKEFIGRSTGTAPLEAYSLYEIECRKERIK